MIKTKKGDGFLKILFKQKPFLGKAVPFLFGLGITPDYEGFNYILESVAIWADYSESAPPLLTKSVYPVIAKKYGKSWQSVERAIRLAVRMATENDDRIARCVAILGVAPRDGFYRNAEFIGLLTFYAVMFDDAA